MSEREPEDEGQPRVTRRQILAAAGGVAGSASIAAAAGSNGDNHITGGDMALDKAHNAAGDLWTGPEAGKSDVKPKAGRMYMTEDTNVVYIADGNDWGDPMRVGSPESPVPSVSTEEGPNKVLNAAPGEMQTKLENATAGDIVRLHAGEQYDPGSETTVPRNVALDFNGAVLTPSSDYNLLFIKPGAAVIDGKADVNDIEWTSVGVRVDTTEDGDSYNAEAQPPFDVDMRIENSTPLGGTGAKIVSDDNARGIFANRLRLHATHMDTMFHADIQGGFANGNEIYLSGGDCGTVIKHTGIDSSSEFINRIGANVQITHRTDVIVDKQVSGSGGPIIYGQLWDAGEASTSLKGDGITVVGFATLDLDSSDGSANQKVYLQRYDRWAVQDLSAGVEWQWKPVAGNSNVYEFRVYDGTTVNTLFKIRDNGSFDFGDTKIRRDKEDLSQRTPDHADEIAIDDGTNTSSGNPAIAVSSGEFPYDWHIMSVDTTITN